jgi:hypothetical protein
MDNEKMAVLECYRITSNKGQKMSLLEKFENHFMLSLKQIKDQI